TNLPVSKRRLTMQNILRLLAGVVLVMAGVSLAGCGERYPELPAVGAPAPEFTLTSQDGRPVSLKDYRGQWVVLYFYPRDFAEQVTADMGSFQKYIPQLAGQHTVIVGISGDNVATNKAFADHQHLQLTLLADEGLKVAKLYGSFHRTHLVYHYVVYSTYIIDPAGKVARVLLDFY